MCWENMWRLWPMLLEEFVDVVMFHWVTWRSVWLLPRFLHNNPWRRPFPLMCLLNRLGNL
jgi:hypothetical protein